MSPLDVCGEVYSWTRVSIDPAVEGTVIVMADFFDGRLRVTAPVKGPGAIEVGSSVFLIEDSESGYSFVPA